MNEPLTEDIQRMVGTARRYLVDATLLERSLDVSSDGSYLLRLTALEILLKALLRFLGKVPGRHHRYQEHFAALPPQAATRLIQAAALRMGPTAAYSDTPALLATWAANFVALRYPYEAYNGMTADEVHRLGAAWLAGGAKPEEATFRYHPLELDGFLCALQDLLHTPGHPIGA